MSINNLCNKDELSVDLFYKAKKYLKKALKNVNYEHLFQKKQCFIRLYNLLKKE
jgi:hypothetical protein